MPDDERVDEVFGTWCEDRDRGDAAAPEDLIRQHPDLADELRVRFATLEILEQVCDAPASQGGAPRWIGDYRILREIGRGGMGVVYEAVQESLERRVALKVLSPAITGMSQSIKRFQREAKAAARLHHTNIVPVYGMGKHAGYWYYAMELVGGRSLSAVIAELKGLEGRPNEETLARLSGAAAPEPERSASAPATDGMGGTATGDRAYYIRVAEMFAGVAEALDLAHEQGVIHRDIKPSNLLLDVEGVLTIVDFGLARISDGSEAMTVTGDVLGTPAYMSPEQAMARRAGIDRRTDVYSLGATLYEALTLRPPFRARDLKELCSQIVTKDPLLPRRTNRHIPRDLETIVVKAMEKDREQRYASAREFARDLRRFAEGGVIRARRIGPFGRTWRRLRRHKVATAMVATIVLLALTAGGLAWRAAQESARRLELEYARLCGLAAEAMATPLDLRRHGDSARDLYEEAIRLVPDRPEAYLGRALTSGSTLEERLGDVETARARGLPVRTYHLARARLLGDAGRRTDAETEQEKARAHPRRTPVDDWFEASLLMAVGNREEASVLLDRAVADSPRGTAVRYLSVRARSKLRLREGDFAGALEDLHRIQEMGDDGLAVQVAVASVWKRMGEEDAAERRFAAILERTARENAVASWKACCQGCWLHEEIEWHGRVTEAALERHPDNPVILYERALAFAARRKFRDQLQACESALERAPRHHRALSFKGRALIRLRRHGEAYETFTRALEAREGCSECLTHRAVALLGLGRARPALADLESAIDLDPTNARAWAMQAEALLGLRDFSGARQAVDRALELDPELSNAHTASGRLLAAEGELEEALAAHRRADELEPDHPMVQFNIGVTLRDLGRKEQALEAVTRAVDLDPDFAPAHSVRSHLLADLERIPQSLEAANRAVELAPRDSDSHFRRAWALEKLGKLPDALEAYNHSVACDPRYALAHAQKGLVHFRMGESGDAIDAYTRAIEIEPNNPFFHFNRSRVHVARNESQEALRDLKRTTEIDDRFLPAHNNRAWMLLGLKRYRQSLEIYDHLLDLDPGHVRAHHYRGYALVALGRHEQAQASFDAAVRLTDSDTPLLNHIAWTLATSADPKVRCPELAASYARRATSGSPGDGDLWNTLGVALCAHGEWKEAVMALETSMRLRSGGDAYDWYPLAVASANLGDPRAAHVWYERAEAWREKHKPDDEELRRFRAEAERAIGDPIAAPSAR